MISSKKAFKAFNDDRLPDAADLLRRAIDLDPKEQTRFYLGEVYASQVVPNLATPDNLQNANLAIEQCGMILKSHPDLIVVLKMEASLYLNTARPDEARILERSAQILDARDAEIPYTIGAIDWREAYKNSVDLLDTEGLPERSDGNTARSPTLCRKFLEKNASVLDDALTNLSRAVDINPDYEEALTYLSLVYRRKADLHCNDAGAIGADLEQADTWAKKAAEARVRAEVKRTAKK